MTEASGTEKSFAGAPLTSPLQGPGRQRRSRKFGRGIGDRKTFCWRAVDFASTRTRTGRPRPNLKAGKVQSVVTDWSAYPRPRPRRQEQKFYVRSLKTTKNTRKTVQFQKHFGWSHRVFSSSVKNRSLMGRSARKITYYKTAPDSRILSPFRTAPNASTPKGAALFAHFWVDPKCLHFIVATHKSPRVSRFFEVA